MALKAGRTGVRKDQVDYLGRIKNGSSEFVDSEEIVWSKEDKKNKANLAQTISNLLARVLTTPIQTPTEKKLVGIDTANAEFLFGYGTDDSGKFLSVNNSGELEWVDAPAGGFFLLTDYIAAVINATNDIVEDSNGRLYYYHNNTDDSLNVAIKYRQTSSSQLTVLAGGLSKIPEVGDNVFDRAQSILSKKNTLLFNTQFTISAGDYICISTSSPNSIKDISICIL